MRAPDRIRQVERRSRHVTSRATSSASPPAGCRWSCRRHPAHPPPSERPQDRAPAAHEPHAADRRPAEAFGYPCYAVGAAEYPNVFRYLAKILACHLAKAGGPRPGALTDFAIGKSDRSSCYWRWTPTPTIGRGSTRRAIRSSPVTAAPGSTSPEPSESRLGNPLVGIGFLSHLIIQTVGAFGGSHAS